MSDLAIIPDAEQLVIDFLRRQPELEPLVERRIYAALPGKPTWPAIRVIRWGGWPVFQNPLWLDQAMCQVDIWGEHAGKYNVSHLARLCRALLDERFVTQESQSVTGITFMALMDSPDQDFTPARPHYRFDIVVLLHPERAPLARSNREREPLAPLDN